MNEDLKLEERNVDNTEPLVLKQLENENFERRIRSFRNKKNFSIVNYIFFVVISIALYIKPIIFSSDKAIYLTIIALFFSLLIIVFEFLIRNELFNQKVSNYILDSYEKKINK